MKIIINIPATQLFKNVTEVEEEEAAACWSLKALWRRCRRRLSTWHTP
jgi:hypothetical protein